MKATCSNPPRSPFQSFSYGKRKSSSKQAVKQQHRTTKGGRGPSSTMMMRVLGERKKAPESNPVVKPPEKPTQAPDYLESEQYPNYQR